MWPFDRFRMKEGVCAPQQDCEYQAGLSSDAWASIIRNSSDEPTGTAEEDGFGGEEDSWQHPNKGFLVSERLVPFECWQQFIGLVSVA